MPPNAKILVVGTTSDYIEWIRHRYPHQALFLTDPEIRRQAVEPDPWPEEEILCDLSDHGKARQQLRTHLVDKGLQIDGVVSYDCESLALAAVLARQYDLPYPSAEAIENCRNKYLSKTLWQQHPLATPGVRLVRSTADATAFFQETGGACVLKPLSGSGSELIFRCDSLRDCEQNFQAIQQGLQQRRNNRLYQSFDIDGPAVLAEAFVNGREYSCDFIIENNRVDIIRLTSKIISSQGPFGTAVGYLLPPALPEDINEKELRSTLGQSAAALGIKRAVCMLDFKVDRGRIVLLELSPRPGGDCLPFLLDRCRNMDILKLAMDFSRQQPLRLKPPIDRHTYAGLRLHAGKSGVLKKIDTYQMESDPRVQKIHLLRKPGHVIKMPPEDYDSWLLGHLIFEPDSGMNAAAQCHSLLEKLVIELE